MFWNLFASRLKIQSCVDRKSSFSPYDSPSNQQLIGPTWPFLGSIRRILSRVTASGIPFRLTFRSLSDVLYSDECWTKKAFQYVEGMLPLFGALVNFIDSCYKENVITAWVRIAFNRL